MGKQHKVAGITNYVDNLMGIAFENSDYTLSNSEIKESYSVGDKIDKYDFDFRVARLVEEPDNPVDPNAIRVELDGVLIGYVKSGSCSEIRNKMHSDNYKGIIITELHYGDYKEVYEDDEGNLSISKNKYEHPFARFEVIESSIAQKTPQESSQVAPTISGSEKPKLNSTKIAAISAVVLIFSIIMMFVAIPVGVVLFVIGVSMLIVSRRNQ